MENTVVLRVEKASRRERLLPRTISIQAAENGFAITAYLDGVFGPGSDRRYVARNTAELLRIIRELVSSEDSDEEQ